jgi:uncharacterized protein (DUF433 family)
MASLVSERLDEPWRRRLFLPNYQIGEAAAYARISPQTVTAWHKIEAAMLPERQRRAPLSYLQLIEVAVVAAFRKMSVPLKRIRAAREYAQRTLYSEFPFSEYRFKEEARHLYLDSEQVEDIKPGTVAQADQEGQLEWEIVIGRLKEFDYEKGGVVLQWHVAGRSSPIVIDPRIAFGAPTVSGTPTWVIKGRKDAGETDSDIAADFGIERSDVREALRFEDELSGGRQGLRVH